MNDVHERVLRAIGSEAIIALTDAGLTVVDVDELDQYQREQDQSVERARRIAKAALDASESRGLLVDILASEDGSLRIVVCDPSGDEKAMAARVVAAIGCAHGPLEKTGTHPKRVTGAAAT